LLIDERSGRPGRSGGPSVTDDPGQSSDYAPVTQLNAQGFAYAAFAINEVAPDDPQSFRSRIINLFYPDTSPLPSNAGRAISAWSWAASRAMDYLVTDPDIESARVYVIGHSRAGKTALWTGAQDTRFRLVVSNESGNSGAKIARHISGETINDINYAFPHWFAEAYTAYNNNEFNLPVDQHELISLVAPRSVYVGSAQADDWEDPQGEFLGFIGALRVYQLYMTPSSGLTESSWPPVIDQPYHDDKGMGYHIRSGDHQLLLSDWQQYMDYASKNIPSASAVHIYSGSKD
jgi:hypothetical protein